MTRQAEYILAMLPGDQINDLMEVERLDFLTPPSSSFCHYGFSVYSAPGICADDSISVREMPGTGSA